MRRTLCLLTICVLCTICSAAETPADPGARVPVRIGVLAYRGYEAALHRWSPMADYLTDTVSDHSFEIVPLNNDDIELFLQNGDVDFILTNPASYAGLEKKYGISRLATLLNAVNGGSHSMYGAVIFTRGDRDDIRKLQDLKGKSFMAVHRNAFGGWWMAQRELVQQGVQPLRDLADLHFSSFPQDQIVFAVRDGRVDAGTVRSSVLERMSAAGHIDLQEFRVLNPQQSRYLTQFHSTRLYPEWPFSATRQVSHDLAQEVALALLSMPTDSAPARAALINGWTAPLDYQPVHELMQELRVGLYRNLGQVTFNDVLHSYWYWMLAILIIFVLMALGVSYVFGLNRRLVLTNRQLEREILVREELEERLKHQALHDSLTGLPNRNLLMDRLRQAVFASEREDRPFALAIIDLDRFKIVNDELGHEYGDRLLKEVAERFAENVRKTDTLARFGGDEFVLLIQCAEGPCITAQLAGKYLACLQQPFVLSGREYSVGASIGIAVYPDHGHTVDTLIRHADLAMYKAKHDGGSVVVYDHSLTSTGPDSNLKQAVEPSI